ncbi:MAG: transcriptional regulator [Osedax symbiont Rs2]|nr:MAG: transcriptional regulator [Osedax symbiont Rs2]
MKLHQIDLNLLLLFDALYRHRSVSAAADEISLSQSAFSHALARLRNRLDDELFIRNNNLMQPTLKGELIADKLSRALPLMQQALNETIEFDPTTSELEFKFTATDFTQFSLLPKLMAAVTQQAPGIKLTILPASNPSPAAQLENADIDFVLGFSHQLQQSKTIGRQTWYRGDYCTIARTDHPALQQGLSLDTFLKLPQVLIAPWGEKSGIVDSSLAKLGLKRKIALQMPSVLAAPYSIINTDMLLTVPRVVAEHCAQQIGIEIYETPLSIEQYQLNIYWHKLNSANAGQRWICQTIEQLSPACSQ